MIPESVKVGTITYRIFVGGSEYALLSRVVGEGEHLGICDSSKAWITIMEGLDPQVTRETLLHEILHAIDQVAGEMVNRVSTEDLTENVIRLFSPGLLLLLRDNPDVVSYLQEGAL